ncbi:MAG: 2-dehydropantoate 2-reductase [Desulfomonilaceae bacterium]
MKIAVVGVGGVGGFFGWRLLEAGEDVVFVTRGETCRVLKETGLTIETLDGDTVLRPVKAFEDPSEVGAVDAVLLAVKSWQVPEAAKTIRPMIGPQTFVLPLQNGVDSPFVVGAELGMEHVLGGLCYIVSFKLGPGHIRHAGLEPRILLGELDRSPSKRTVQMRDALVAAGVRAEIPEDIQAAMWEKFLFIASLSGICAVTRAPAGPIRSIPETRSMLIQTIEEIRSLARAKHITLKPDIVDSAMAVVDGLPEDATTSMQRDIMEGRPSELEALNGFVAKSGAERGIPVPLNSFLYWALIPQERAARKTLS